MKNQWNKERLTEEMIERFKKVLDQNLPPAAVRWVYHINGVGGHPQIYICWAASEININGVKGQKPQKVGLIFDTEDLTIMKGYNPPVIWRKPNKEVRKEKCLAMTRERIPFKLPSIKPEHDNDYRKRAAEKVVARVAQRWVELLKLHRPVLEYQDLVNYDELL